MKSVVGIFGTWQEAAKAANLLRTVGFEGRNVILLSPGASERDVQAAIPAEDAEQPGMGKAIGSVVGGAPDLVQEPCSLIFCCRALVLSWP